jgi:lysophospholipase L1-like esterase
MSKIVLRTAGVLAAVIAGLLIGELLLRVFAGVPAPAARGAGGLLFSSGTWDVDADGAVRYQRNREIRTIRVHDGQVVYDLRFRTNNLGFIDHRDYPTAPAAGRRHYAFVGDSFTAGYHGGEAWVPRLRDDWRRANVEIYNLGVDGTGIEHFRRLLMSARRQLRIDAIAILAISHDFRRGFWQPQTTDRDIAFCRDPAGKRKCSRIAAIVRPDAPLAEILERVAPPAVAPVTDWFRASRLLALAKRASRNWSERFGQQRELVEQSLESLHRLRAAFPNAEIHLIHLPEADEVVAGRYRLDIAARVAGMGIDYFSALERCPWSGDMFFEHDMHPNDRGYRHIAQCVAGHLFGAAAARGSRESGADPTRQRPAGRPVAGK